MTSQSRFVRQFSEHRFKDSFYMKLVEGVAEEAKCVRRKVGCILVDSNNNLLSMGYNGRARGLANCGGGPLTGDTVFRCPNSDAPPGEPNGCESIHAEQNALLQCRDVSLIHTAYVTIAPCLVCVKMLMNTGCQRIVFGELYAYADAQRLWVSSGRSWVHDSRG